MARPCRAIECGFGEVSLGICKCRQETRSAEYIRECLVDFLERERAGVLRRSAGVARTCGSIVPQPRESATVTTDPYSGAVCRCTKWYVFTLGWNRTAYTHALQGLSSYPGTATGTRPACARRVPAVTARALMA